MANDAMTAGGSASHSTAGMTTDNSAILTLTKMIKELSAAVDKFSKYTGNSTYANTIWKKDLQLSYSAYSSLNLCQINTH